MAIPSITCLSKGALQHGSVTGSDCSIHGGTAVIERRIGDGSHGNGHAVLECLAGEGLNGNDGIRTLVGQLESDDDRCVAIVISAVITANELYVTAAQITFRFTGNITEKHRVGSR